MGGISVKKNNFSTRQLTFAAMFIALTTVATMVISIPIPGTNGYVNIGDTFVLLSGLIFSHYFGALIGGVGSAMADIFLGYTIYAPITLIVKGIEGFIAGKLGKESKFSIIMAVICAVIWMPIGYFIFEALIFNVPIAVGSLLANYVQGVVSGILALLLYPIIVKLIEVYGVRTY